MNGIAEIGDKMYGNCHNVKKGNGQTHSTMPHASVLVRDWEVTSAGSAAEQSSKSS